MVELQEEVFGCFAVPWPVLVWFKPTAGQVTITEAVVDEFLLLGPVHRLWVLGIVAVGQVAQVAMIEMGPEAHLTFQMELL
ncbi:MAG: hypothetical protein DRP79_08180 [Planctomycetota bacterium]|nr:MAG: hypothetical protein DRP79_08180 [Planctomycetota bacterium]